MIMPTTTSDDDNHQHHLSINPSTSNDSLGITLPWEEEGTDHAYEETTTNGDLHSGPLHETVTNERRQHQQQRINVDNATKAHSTSLRLRAAKYIRGNHSPRPFSPSESTNSNSSSESKVLHRRRRTTPGFFPSTSPPPISSSNSTPSPSPTFSNYSDPPLTISPIEEDHHPSSTTTLSVTATSVSYGSDLENAARRILDRKKKGRGGANATTSSSGVGSVNGGSVSGSWGGSVTGGGESSAHHLWSSRRNTVQQQPQQQQQHRRPSRERMQKITRRSFSLPMKYSDTEEDLKEDDATMTTTQKNKPEFQFLSHPPNRNDANDKKHILSPSEEEDETIAILRYNAEKNRRRNSHSPDDDDDEDEEEETTGAFPSFRPDPPDEDKVVSEVSFGEMQDWNWNDVTSSSWVDPDRAFMDVGDENNDDDDEEEEMNQYDELHFHKMDESAQEDSDVEDDVQDNSLNYTTSDIVQPTTKDGWNDQWYQCELDVSSVEEEEESEEEEKGFDGDDYFHDFGRLNHNNSSSWGLNPKQQETGWEDLPSPVEFSPRRRRLGGAAENGGGAGDRVEGFQDDEYVTRTSEIDFFAWDDDDVHVNANGNGGKDEKDVFGETYQTPKPSKGIMLLDEHKTEFKQENEHHQTNIHMNPPPTPTQTYPLSDGGTPTRKARMGLSFFRSRNQPEGSWNYHSEGERSNSDWESSPKKSSSRTPMRSTRWKNKQKIQMSPRSFFERRQEKQKKTEKEPSVLSAQYEMLRKDSDFSKSFIGNLSQEGMEKVESANDISKSTIDAAAAVSPHQKQVIERLNQTKAPKSTIAVNTRQQDSVSSNPISTKPPAASMVRTSTPVTNLNDSMLTQTTPLMSNKGLLNEMPRPPSFNKNNPNQGGSQTPKSPRLPPHLHNSPSDKKISSSRKKPPSPGFTGSDIIVDKEEVDDACSISTLHTESLGSLVTKATPARAKTDASVRSGMSEIERLRRENERLREKLENRSEASSKVSSEYVRTLQEQNKLLRRHLNNSSPKRRTNIKRNDSDIMYKSTIATLLEREDPSRRRRSRRKNNSSPRKSRGAHGRKPSAPLIHADFDDESITTYSESINGKRVQLIRDANCEGVPGILQAIATTTHKVASQVKTAAQDRNKPTANDARSCELFTTVCRRRGTTGGKETGACGSSAHSTKEVIGRAFGCIKPHRVEGKTKHDPAKSTANSAGSVQTTDSDSLNHGAASYDEPKIMFAGTPGVAVQL